MEESHDFNVTIGHVVKSCKCGVHDTHHLKEAKDTNIKGTHRVRHVLTNTWAADFFNGNPSSGASSAPPLIFPCLSSPGRLPTDPDLPCLCLPGRLYPTLIPSASERWQMAPDTVWTRLVHMCAPLVTVFQVWGLRPLLSCLFPQTSDHQETHWLS